MSTIAPSGTMSVGIPSRGVCASHFARTLADLAMWDRMHGRQNLHPDHPFIWNIGSAQILNARNLVVRKFLEQGDGGADWLVFFDDDQVYPKHTLEVLAESVHPTDRRIVGIPVWRYSGGEDADEMRVTHNVFDVAESGLFVEWPEGLPENAVLPVGAVGTGCMAVHRSVLVEMREASAAAGQGVNWAWFRQVIHQPIDMVEGEDLAFCRFAHSLGISVWVNTCMTLEHVKPTTLHRATAGGVYHP